MLFSQDGCLLGEVFKKIRNFEHQFSTVVMSSIILKDKIVTTLMVLVSLDLLEVCEALRFGVGIIWSCYHVRFFFDDQMISIIYDISHCG